MRVQRGQHAIDGRFHRGALINIDNIVLTGAGEDFGEQLQLLIGHHARIGRLFLGPCEGGKPDRCATQHNPECGSCQQ